MDNGLRFQKKYHSRVVLLLLLKLRCELVLQRGPLLRGKLSKNGGRLLFILKHLIRRHLVKPKSLRVNSEWNIVSAPIWI